MSVDAILLTFVLLLLFMIYRKISKTKDTWVQCKEYFDSFQSNLHSIGRSSYKSMKYLEEASIALNWQYPAGKESYVSKRNKNLITLYAKYLAENENLSPEDSLVRSNFEFNKFKDEFEFEQRIKNINEATEGVEKEKAEQAFFSTGNLEKECREEIAENHLPGYYLFAPIWAILKRNYPLYSKEDNGEHQKVNGKKVIHFDVFMSSKEKSYSDYVKNRSIILRLLDLGIIERVVWKSIPNKYWDKYWLDNPTFIFKIEDLEKIKSLVYNGEGHEEEFFEERYLKGEISPRLIPLEFYAKSDSDKELFKLSPG